MWLDQFLHGKKYVGSMYDLQIIRQSGTELMANTPEENPVKYIIYELGYWRKANAIHKWFVDNVQHWEDDCGDYRVTTEHLMTLSNTIDRVLADNTLAPELLPPTAGFFYWTTEYDDYYFYTLRYTKEVIAKALECGDQIEYTSSW